MPAQRPAARCLHRVVPSDLTEVDTLCQELKALLQKNGEEKLCFPAELAARECLTNAMIHGNGGDTNKEVTLEARIGRRWVVVKIRDEGSGFDWTKARRTPFPGEEATSGRGLLLVRLYSHHMAFNRPGNQVTLWLEKEERAIRRERR